MGTGSSLACPQYHHHHRDQAHSRLTSAITAPQTPRWRPPATGDYASQPLTGTRRAALLGTCARARATRRHAPSSERQASIVAITSRVCVTLRLLSSAKRMLRYVTGLRTKKSGAPDQNSQGSSHEEQAVSYSLYDPAILSDRK